MSHTKPATGPTPSVVSDTLVREAIGHPQETQQAGHIKKRTDGSGAQPSRRLSLRQVNVLRVGYFLMGVVLAVIKWPLLFNHEHWGLAEGTKECLLIAMSVLALLGLRYPVRMLPILLFEVAWKLLWLGMVAFPLWSDDKLEGATRTQTGMILWVVVIIAVIPWRYVLNEYVLTQGDPWRRTRTERSA